ncbi:hypothetical protein PF003_g20687 [Phytophthora fragariae]|nr:hypothetical protein PF003_g20687 [Phytophthora fragariae]
MPSAGTEIPDRKTDSASEPALKKRRLEVGTKSMHLHFANLMDEKLTVQRSTNQLHQRRDGKWVPWRPLCRFPAIDEDVLLYLAVLGGKTYSGYFDRVEYIPHSTLEIFKMYPKGKGFSTHKNPNALANDFNAFENMVAHSIFCASRKKGVGGILFDDFFFELLCEFQDEPRLEKMKIEDKTVVASDLLKGYDDLAYLRETRIPFLAPPNATWPEYILDTRARRVGSRCDDNCHFGHLIRAANKERCDAYVVNMESEDRIPLFHCECKHWSKRVGSETIESIISGLNSAWPGKWALSVVFCVELAVLRKEWVHKDTGCVKIDCKTRSAEWVSEPESGVCGRKKLLIVVETGSLDLTNCS